MGRTDSLIRTTPETKKHLEAIRGRHRKKGKDWFPNLVTHLEDPEEGSSEWWDRAEFLALASIYLERRTRGHSMGLLGAADLFQHLLEGKTTLSAQGKYRLYRLLAAPLLTYGAHFSRFTRYPSREYVENRDRRSVGRRQVELGYRHEKLIKFFGLIHEDATTSGFSPAQAFHDCMVTAWLEYHKDIWYTDADNYTYHLTMSGWDNQTGADIVQEMIDAYEEFRTRPDEVTGEPFGAQEKTAVLRGAAVVINDLAEHLGTSVTDIELTRVFSGFIAGNTSAEELPKTIELWEGMQDQEAKAAINDLLQRPTLLNLASPRHALKSLMDGKSVKDLTVDLLEHTVNDTQLQSYVNHLQQSGMDWRMTPESADFEFQDWQELLCEPAGYYDWHKNEEADQRLRGLRAFLISMLLPNRATHGRMAATVKAWLMQAEHTLDKLIRDNEDCIRAARSVFYSALNKEPEEEEDIYRPRWQRRRDLHYPKGVTLDSFELTEDELKHFRAPVMASCLLKDMENKVRKMIADKVSDLVDADWKTLDTTEISFDD